MPWAKGQSGNPSGGRRKPWLGPGLRSLLAKRPEPGKPTHREAVLLQLVTLAENGDLGAIRLILDRIDGPVPNGASVERSDGRMQIVLTWPEDEDADAHA